MNIVVKVLGGLLVVVVSFFLTLWITNYFSPMCPSGSGVALVGPFTRFAPNGAAFIAKLPGLDAYADSVDAPQRSRITVCEDGHLLGPAHTIHAEIAKQGKGRYSHWKGVGVIFSTSDNSDPNLSGRYYWIVR
jgi:hypothetical protein